MCRHARHRHFRTVLGSSAWWLKGCYWLRRALGLMMRRRPAAAGAPAPAEAVLRRPAAAVARGAPVPAQAPLMRRPAAAEHRGTGPLQDTGSRLTGAREHVLKEI